MLLEAQILSLSGKKPSQVQSCFDDAINLAVQRGYKQDAGLGSVLAAEHFLTLEDSVLCNPILQTARDSLVGNYVSEAYEMYEDWGATALVDSLHQKYSKYLDIASKEMAQEKGKGVLNISQTLEDKDNVSILSNHSAGWRLRQEASKQLWTVDRE